MEHTNQSVVQPVFQWHPLTWRSRKIWKLAAIPRVSQFAAVSPSAAMVAPYVEQFEPHVSRLSRPALGLLYTIPVPPYRRPRTRSEPTRRMHVISIRDYFDAMDEEYLHFDELRRKY